MGILELIILGALAVLALVGAVALVANIRKKD